jgi:transposase
MARIKGPRKVGRNTAEFKLKAVRLSQIDGVRVQDVADALEIYPFMLSRWRKLVRVESLLPAARNECRLAAAHL